MSMIRNLGDGYYGIEATGRTIAPVVLDRMTEAFSRAASIPDSAITIGDYRYEADAPKHNNGHAKNISLPFESA